MSDSPRSSVDLLPDERLRSRRRGDLGDLRPDDDGLPEHRDMRFRVPGLPSATVRRTDRLPKLAEINAGVVALTAPAGYGKTTLIEEWADIDNRPFVYVAISERDNGSQALAGSVARAFAPVKPTDHRRLRRASDREVSALLVSVFERPCAPFVLVLDDLHLLSSAHGDAIVHMLAEHLPGGSQLVLAGRRTSQFHLARLRASHGLYELSEPALALRDDESEALLERCGVELASDAVAALAERTEGWAAALYLATLSIRELPDPHRAALDFTGNRFIAEYIQDEILRGVPYHVVEFLRRTSVLERMSGPLCDAVLEQGGSARMLANAAAAKLVLSLDEHGDSYRLHHLLREMLSDDLRQRDPELHSALHVRASIWSEEQREYDSAVRHAIAGGDTSRAGDLIWKALPSFAAGDQPSTLSHWLESFDHSALVGESTLALAVAGSKLANGDPAEVEWWITVARESDGDEYLPSGERRDAVLALLNAFVGKDGLRDMREQAEFACRHLPMSSPFHFLACAHEAWALHLEGDRSARSKWDALVQMSAVRMPQAEAAGEALFALAAIEDGNWTDAEARIRRARSIIREHPILEEKPGQAVTFAVSALCHAHASSDATIDWNRARELLTHLKGFEPWDAIVTRCALIRASLLVDDVAAARNLAAEAFALLDSMSGWDELRPGVTLVCAMVDRAESASTGMAAALTSAELRVLRRLPSHLSLGEIAGELFVARNTVKSQVLAVYRKLNVSSRAEAVTRAREFGLVEQYSD